MAKKSEKIIPSSGNVFADLRLKDAHERQTRIRLAVALNQIVQARGLSQAEAARKMGISQPKVSALQNYKLEGFSVERLMTFLTALDLDVDIVIRTKSDRKKPARVTVTAA
jgi:predicted XRE-type DNA-binding protein